MSRWPRSAVRGPLPESTMPLSRRSMSVDPRVSERLTATIVAALTGNGTMTTNLDLIPEVG